MTSQLLWIAVQGESVKIAQHHHYVIALEVKIRQYQCHDVQPVHCTGSAHVKAQSIMSQIFEVTHSVELMIMIAYTCRIADALKRFLCS